VVGARAHIIKPEQISRDNLETPRGALQYMVADLTWSFIGWNPTTFIRGQVPVAQFQVWNVSADSVNVSFTAQLYLSKDNVITADDFLITDARIAGLGAGVETDVISAQNAIPSDFAAGNYWLILSIDTSNEVNESNELNNSYLMNDLSGQYFPPGFFQPIVFEALANHLPSALPDSVVMQKGTTVSKDAAHGVLVNDSDPDIRDTLHVTTVNGLTTNVGHSVVGAFGALTINADGSYVYVANANAKAGEQDVFSYSIDDGHGGIAGATFDVTIAKQASNQVALPFSGNYDVTQGPNDAAWGDHNGYSKWSYDFNLPVGTAVLSVGHGTVVDLREYVPDGGLNSMLPGNVKANPNDPSNGNHNFGNYVTIQLDDGTYVSYLHLGQNKVSVGLNQEVNTGDVLGFTGLTGARTGPHLHIQFGTEAQTFSANTSDALHGVKDILADGSGDKLSPEYFAALTVHLVDGADNLYHAGPGTEKFVFKSLSDVSFVVDGAEPKHLYTIDGFQHDVDKIDLTALDANVALPGNQSFSAAVSSNSVLANSVTWHEEKGDTIVRADVNSNGIADFALTLTGVNLHLAAADFLL
jgi:VCBS repeat-containing protein